MNNEPPPFEFVSSANATVNAKVSAAGAVIEEQQRQQQKHRIRQQQRNQRQFQQQQQQQHQSTSASLAFGETFQSTTDTVGGNVRRAATTAIRPCRYFLRGNCRHGARCKFSHEVIDEGELVNNHRETLSHLAQRLTLAAAMTMASNSNSNNATAANTNTMTLTSSLSTFLNLSATATLSSSSQTSISNIDCHNNYAKLVKWAEAPAFVPRNPRMITTPLEIETEAKNTTEAATMLQRNLGSRRMAADRTWADVVSGREKNNVNDFKEAASVKLLCPYRGCCPHADNCVYALHWELCKMCDKYCLHPTDMEQRRRHNKKCLQRHEEDMEISFAVARSRDKVCGICMEIILEMPHGMRRFGILPQCNHVFCLGCIRKWRQMPDFSHSVTRSCPQCRVTSSFICPSLYWVDTKEQKDQLINDYRASLGRKDCKYFKMGKGKCPFGNRCFYRHALPHGESSDSVSGNGGSGGGGGGVSSRIRRVATHSTNRNSNSSAVRVVNLVDFCLWDFVEQRNMSCVDSLLQGNNFVNVVEYDETDSD